MEKPLITDVKTPLSLTLGSFSFVPDSDAEIKKLREEIQELKNRIATLEQPQQRNRTPWWKRFKGLSQNL
jgi:hypothetical protein